MRKLEFSDAAEADLEAIGDYIAADSPGAAAILVRKLRFGCRDISSSPLQYARIPGFETRGLRRRVVGRYLIFFHVDDERVTILRILDGARDYAQILFADD